MRKFVLGLLFSFSVAIGYSQFVIFGAKAGLNLSTFTGNDVENAKMYPSFHVGGLANFYISENFMVQPEVLYSGKGAKFDGGTYRLGYISVPVLLQYKTTSGFFLEAGPQVSFLTTAKLKYAGADPANAKDLFKSTDYSVLGGLGYKSAMGIGAGLRYDFGFFNVANAGIIRNKTIMLSVFYTFGSSQED